MFVSYSSRFSLEFKISHWLSENETISNHSVSCELFKSENKPEIILDPSASTIPLTSVMQSTTTSLMPPQPTISSSTISSSNTQLYTPLPNTTSISVIHVNITMTSTIIIFATKIVTVEPSRTSHTTLPTSTTGASLFSTSSFDTSVVLLPSMQSIPLQSIPLQSIPLQSISMQSISMLSIPLQSIPLQSISMQSIPLQSIPLQSISMLSIPLQSISMQSIPLQSISLQSISLQSIPLQSIPLQSIPLQSSISHSPHHSSLLSDISSKPTNTIRQSTVQTASRTITNTNTPVTGGSLGNDSSSMMNLYLSLGIIVPCALILAVLSGVICYFSGKRRQKRYIIRDWANTPKNTTQLELLETRVVLTGSSTLESTAAPPAAAEPNDPSTTQEAQNSPAQSPVCDISFRETTISTFKPETAATQASQPAQSIELQPVQADYQPIV